MMQAAKVRGRSDHFSLWKGLDAFHANYGTSSPTQGAEVKWKAAVDLQPQRKNGKRGKLYLSSTIAPAHARKTESGSGLSASVLKSVLQKSVRRRKAMSALRTAAELLRCHPHREFYRRMYIICIEDVGPHESLPVFAWLMAADAKGFVSPDELIIFLLQAVYCIATSERGDAITVPRCMRISLADIWNIPSDLFGTKAEVAKIVLSACKSGESEAVVGLLNALDECEKNSLLLTEEISICRSMCLRRAFGGMAGDKLMLCETGCVWLLRFLAKSEGITCTDDLCQNGHLCGEIVDRWRRSICQTSDELESFAQQSWIGALQRGDVCIAGIDFHCCPRIFDQLPWQNIPIDRRTVSNDVLKTAMWHHSSSVNTRKPLIESPGREKNSSGSGGKNTKSLWQKIAPFVQQYQRRYISRFPFRQRNNVGATSANI